MGTMTVRYLHVIGGYLHYRRRVPQDLRLLIGKSEWVHSLGLPAGQERKALPIVSEYDTAYARLIAQARVQVLSRDLLPLFVTTETTTHNKPEAKVPGVMLSEAYRYDQDAHGGDRNERAVMQAVDNFIALFGDADIISMTPRDVQKWINLCTEKGQKASTIQRRVNAIRAIISRYYRDHEIERTNPFSKPNIKQGYSSSSDRLPFHRSHIKVMDHYFQSAPRISDDVKRLYTLLKLTGARPLELGGLDCDDLFLDHDVPHLWIRNNSHRRVKTKGSERRIPLVGDALQAARLQKETTRRGALFSENFHETNALSQRLNKLIRRAGVPKSPRLVVYSFRHTMEEAMRSAGVREHTQKRIMGHTDGSITGRYGAPAGLLEELQTAIRNSIPVLGKVDLSIYAEQERI